MKKKLTTFAAPALAFALAFSPVLAHASSTVPQHSGHGITVHERGSRAHEHTIAAHH